MAKHLIVMRERLPCNGQAVLEQTKRLALIESVSLQRRGSMRPAHAQLLQENLPQIGIQIAEGWDEALDHPFKLQQA